MGHEKKTLDEWIQEASRGLRKIPADVEKELVHKYQNGQGQEREEALDLLVAYNILPIVDIALKVYYSFPGATKVDIMDLIYTGIVAFIEKLDRFDAERARLITFYTRDIMTKMQRFIIKYGHVVQTGSVYLQYLASKTTAIRNKIEQEKNRTPTIAEIAAELNVRPETIEAVNKYTTVVTHNVHASEDNVIQINEDALDDDTYPVDKIISILQMKLPSLSKEEFQELIIALTSGEDIPEHLADKIRKDEILWQLYHKNN